MEYRKSEWNGFLCLDFKFEDRDAKLVCPQEPCEGKKWLLKTEYFGAFPAFEVKMLKKGYHVAYVSNQTRWHAVSDDDVKAKFCDFLQSEFGLHRKCLPVGMSCGGMHAVYFGAKYPELVAGLYLDAPVLNLLSCPCGIGGSTDSMYEEFVKDTGMTKSDLINYRNHPIDYVKELVEHKIPVFLVAGDSDGVVPYVENGKPFYEYYVKHGGDISQIVKPGCDHHPHGLADQEPLITFTERVYQI